MNWMLFFRLPTGNFKRSFIIKSALLLFLMLPFMGPSNTYGYSITLQPLDQSVKMGFVDVGIVAMGYDYIKYNGIYTHPWNEKDYVIDMGASLTSGVSKIYQKGDVVTNTFIRSESWYFGPDWDGSGDDFARFEWFHGFNGTYLLNISSDFDDMAPINITGYDFSNFYYTSGLRIYDSLGKDVYQNHYYNWHEGYSSNEYFTSFDFILLPELDYFVEFYVFEDWLDREMYHQFEFSIVESFPVPEPSTWLLFGTGLMALFGFGRKKFISKN